MNIRQLPYILAIASTGSISSAARQLNVSQPALSKYLTELEKSVGMELFFRHKKRLYPTQAGKVYIEAARKIVALQVRTRDSIRLLHDGDTEEIHFGMSPHRGAVNLARVFPAFRQQFPQTRIIPHDGYSLTLAAGLLDGKISCAVTSHMRSFSPQLTFLPLFREEIVLGVPRFHRMAQEQNVTEGELPIADLEDFCDSSFIMPERPSALCDAVQPMWEQSHFHPAVTFSSPNVILSEAMIRSGAGVGPLPAEYVKQDPDIVYFRLRRPGYMTTGLLFKTGHTFSAAERFLIFLHMQLTARNHPFDIIWDDPFLSDIIQEFYHTQAYIL